MVPTSIKKAANQKREVAPQPARAKEEVKLEKRSRGTGLKITTKKKRGGSNKYWCKQPDTRICMKDTNRDQLKSQLKSDEKTKNHNKPGFPEKKEQGTQTRKQ